MRISFAVFKLLSSIWNGGSRDLEATIKEENFETAEQAESFIQETLLMSEYKNDRYIIHKIYSNY